MASLKDFNRSVKSLRRDFMAGIVSCTIVRVCYGVINAECPESWIYEVDKKSGPINSLEGLVRCG